MIRKKNSFFTFCFSFLPGAGQMYMGFMKRGITLMSAFFLLIFLASWLNLSQVMFAMPIIWFFAFFDTFNLRAMPDDEFYAMEDEFLLVPDFMVEKTRFLRSKFRNIFALVLIFIGFSILWGNLTDLLDYFLPDEVSDAIYRIGYYFPQLVVGVAIVAFGIYLINGKKNELQEEEKNALLEDKGGF